MIEELVKIDSDVVLQDLFGCYDENINLIRKEFNIKIFNMSCELKLTGCFENVDSAKKAIESMILFIRKNKNLPCYVVKKIIYSVKNNELEFFNKIFDELVCLNSNKKPILVKTLSQKKYVDAVKNNIITFGCGPSGTGKTYLAVALAVCAFKEKKVSKIIVTRPIVEAGESLGFLPGDIQSKINPYLRPLYDAIIEIIGVDSFNRHIERKNIEIAPLAYMRGRNLSSSFIILDEAQNATSDQMKMFLTRLGFGSKIIVTGDVTQIDLPNKRQSGLKEAMELLKDIKDIEIVSFSEQDIVRHELVQKIVNAYDKLDV